MLSYERRGDFAAEFDISFSVEGNPSDVHEDRMLNGEEFLLLESEVHSVNGRHERREHEESIFPVPLSADEESLVLEVTAERDGFEFPVFHAVLAHPRIESRVQPGQLHRRILRDTVANRLPTSSHALVLRVVVERAITGDRTQRCKRNSTSAWHAASKKSSLHM